MLAKELLEVDLPNRFAHVAGVASCAHALCEALDRDGTALVAAAWLHDIGYALQVHSTGFHPLDGARYLAQLGYEAEVVGLVAFHSGARVEAELRGQLGPLETEFAPPDPDLLALLTYCDMTTGPRGQRMTLDQRLEDIFERYDPRDVVYRSISSSAAQLKATVGEVEAQLVAQSQ